MEITKKFTSKNEVAKFKKEYSEGTVKTEVISNLIQPCYAKSSQAINNYCDFWFPLDEKYRQVISPLMMCVSMFGPIALLEKFGKHDFVFEGNRKYQNYVLSYDDLTIVAPAKREVVISFDKNEELMRKLVDFENCYTQMVVDFLCKYISSGDPRIEKEDIEIIENLKKLKIINDENQIDFLYMNKNLEKTNRLKLGK